MGVTRHPKSARAPRALRKGEPLLDVFPTKISAGPPIHSRMVLLVQDRGILGVADHLVDAGSQVLPIVHVLLPRPTDPCIVHLPRFSGIVRGTDSGSRDPHQHPLGVPWIP